MLSSTPGGGAGATGVNGADGARGTKAGAAEGAPGRGRATRGAIAGRTLGARSRTGLAFAAARRRCSRSSMSSRG